MLWWVFLGVFLLMLVVGIVWAVAFADFGGMCATPDPFGCLVAIVGFLGLLATVAAWIGHRWL